MDENLSPNETTAPAENGPANDGVEEFTQGYIPLANHVGEQFPLDANPVEHPEAPCSPIRDWEDLERTVVTLEDQLDLKKKLAPTLPLVDSRFKFATAKDLIVLPFADKQLIRLGAVGLWDTLTHRVVFRPEDVVCSPAIINFIYEDIYIVDALDKWKIEEAF